MVWSLDISLDNLPDPSTIQVRLAAALGMHASSYQSCWSLCPAFLCAGRRVTMMALLQEGEFVTGITGKVVYSLVNFFPNLVRPDDSTSYWTKWCGVRIGHEATEIIRCNFDPVQGLLLGEGVQVDQEHVFEDGEGALINPYQKYRMVIGLDGSIVATLFAGGEWDAVFRAHPF